MSKVKMIYQLMSFVAIASIGAIAVNVVVSGDLSKAKEQSTYVNVAGKQRALINKFQRDILAGVESKGVSPEATMKMLKTHGKALLEGGKAENGEINIAKPGPGRRRQGPYRPTGRPRERGKFLHQGPPRSQGGNCSE